MNYEVNLYRLSNAISLWLGIQPPDLFFYAFLPPLLVDAALRLDWFVFTKVSGRGEAGAGGGGGARRGQLKVRVRVGQLMVCSRDSSPQRLGGLMFQVK